MIERGVILLVAISKFTFLFGQDSSSLFSVNRLYFCNSYHAISKLWPLSDGLALGARRFNSGKEDYHIKDIVLIGRDGLIKDSLSLKNFFKSRDYYFEQIQSVSVESSQRVYVHSGRTIIPVGIQGHKLVVEDTLLPYRRKEILNWMYSNYPDLLNQFVLIYKNFVVGYDRDKFKVKKQGTRTVINDDEKNFPKFWIVDVASEKPEKVYINRNDVARHTDALFWDVKDWDQTWSRVNVFSRYVSVFHNKIYFSVARANLCYVFDVDTRSVSIIPYPPVIDGESCQYYYDQLSGNEYVVKRTKGNSFKVYQYSESYSRALLVTTLNHRPLNIFNDRLHLIREEKNQGKRMLCHYLIPLKDEKTDKLTVLDEVIIKY
jgi:hypothetical protein